MNLILFCCQFTFLQKFDNQNTNKVIDIVFHVFQGDSGGPLHCNMKDGRWYLAGLTSFGSGCAKPGYPDVFMRLTSYTKWIEETIQNHHLH